MTKSKSLIPADYSEFLVGLKERIRAAQVSASRSVNRELILLYWDIGCSIVEKQQSAKWGEAVVERIAKDLRNDFPQMKGFSANNLWLMRLFYSEYSQADFLEQAVQEFTLREKSLISSLIESTRPANILAQAVPDSSTSRLKKRKNQAKKVLEQPVQDIFLIRQFLSHVPWGHHLEILKKVKSPASRIFYLASTIRLGWSRSVLLNQIKAKAYERSRLDKKSNNFALALPEHFAEQAQEMMKSSYNLEFLGIREAVLERDLENRLIESVQQFILELGYGFCFVGRQYRLALGSKEYFVDLLFYHRFLKALVALDLKIRGFIPEDAGKMDFYLNLLNDRERESDDKPSIGIILCAEKDDIEVEYALKSKSNPIGVAEYQLQSQLPTEFKGKLPTARQLTDAIRRSLPNR